jgi:hypothetical protein
MRAAPGGSEDLSETQERLRLGTVLAGDEDGGPLAPVLPFPVHHATAIFRANARARRAAEWIVISIDTRLTQGLTWSDNPLVDSGKGPIAFAQPSRHRLSHSNSHSEQSLFFFDP